MACIRTASSGHEGLALAIGRQLGDAWITARGLLSEGMIAHRTGDLARAESLIEESLRLSQSNGLSVTEYYNVMSLGLVALERGDHIRAGELGAACLELAKRIGHARGSANALYVLARAAVGRGDHLEYNEIAPELAALNPANVRDALAWYATKSDFR